MSYFCCNTISIDKKNKTCKVKGGDNNVVPRSNQWSNPFPVELLLYDVSGGMIQFTSRNEKNLLVESIVDKYTKKIKELTDLHVFDVFNLIDGKDTIAKKLSELESIAPDHWNIGTIVKQIAILKNDDLINELINLKCQFVNEVVNPEVDKYAYIVKYEDKYVYSTRKSSVQVTPYREAAKQMSRIMAEGLIKDYGPEFKLEQISTGPQQPQHTNNVNINTKKTNDQENQMQFAF